MSFPLSREMKDRKKRFNQIADRFKLDIVYAFGSNAGGVVEWLGGTRAGLSLSPLSDVDIGVRTSPERKLTVKEKVQLALALEDLFSVSRVDLVVIQEADPFLAANIIRGERIYCRDEYRADEYDLYILRRAGDLAPLERERLALIMGSDE